MAFDGRIKNDPTANKSNNPLYREQSNIGVDTQAPNLVKQNPQMPMARRNRQVIKWRVPGMGTVSMYINPQTSIIN